MTWTLLIGTGAYKLGANYAPGVLAQKFAATKGYAQNLWLFGEENYLTEVGTMNLFVVLKKPDGSESLLPFAVISMLSSNG